MQADPTSFLMNTGTRSFKFDKIEATIKGRITDLEVQQQRDYNDNTPKYWDDGKPMNQLKVVLETEDRDDVDDDGLRAIYVRGQMQSAVRDAIKTAGAATIEVGGILAVQYIGDGEKTNPKHNPPKQYRAQYSPPTKSVAAADLI